MSFRETYGEAVRDSRRIRAQRAGFWAKWVSLALVLTVGATLRSEPELRLALMTAGMDAVAAFSGHTAPPASDLPEDASLQALLRQAAAHAPLADAPATLDAVKVNRPGLGADAGPGIQRIRVVPQGAPASADPSAAQIDQLLQQLRSGQ